MRDMRGRAACKGASGVKIGDRGGRVAEELALRSGHVR